MMRDDNCVLVCHIPLPAPARDVLATLRRRPATQPDLEREERADSLWKGRAIVAHVEPSLPSPHKLEMCLQRLGIGLPLSSIWTGGGWYSIFGNGNLFPFPMFDVWKWKHVSWKQVSISGNKIGIFSVSNVFSTATTITVITEFSIKARLKHL